MKNFKTFTFKSTRSNNSPDEYRDMSGFDIDLELSILKKMISILENRQHPPPSKTEFSNICEAFKNIDEHLYRCGELPDRWEKATTKKKLKEHQKQLEDKHMKCHD
jgi:hypothetical protein